MRQINVGGNPAGFAYSFADYMTDTVNKVNITGAGTGINPPTFGDVANTTSSFYVYLDSAANRGTVSYCAAGSTYEFLIIGANQVNFKDKACFVGFNSFIGNGNTVSGNPGGSLTVPIVKY